MGHYLLSGLCSPRFPKALAILRQTAPPRNIIPSLGFILDNSKAKTLNMSTMRVDRNLSEISLPAPEVGQIVQKYYLRASFWAIRPAGACARIGDREESAMSTSNKVGRD
jgi:hypothetical protein